MSCRDAFGVVAVRVCVCGGLTGCLAWQVDRLQNAGVSALAITSLTPKEAVNDMYKQIESDPALKLLYGKRWPLLFFSLHKAYLRIDAYNTCL